MPRRPIPPPDADLHANADDRRPAGTLDTPADAATDADPASDSALRPSKSQRKRDSHALQDLGEALVSLAPSRLAALDLDDGLRLAVDEYRRTRSHEGRRRQMQYIGKLMRKNEVEPIRQAVTDQELGRAHDSLALHQAEHWRAELLASDEALTRWLGEHPDTDTQWLRSLVRSARKDEAALHDAKARGEATRKGRAYRELFQHIREALKP